MNNDIKFLNIEWRTWYSRTNFEDHFGLHASVIFYTPICVVSFTFVGCFDRKLKWLIGRIDCLYYSTRVDLYSHQILFPSSLFTGILHCSIPSTLAMMKPQSCTKPSICLNHFHIISINWIYWDPKPCVSTQLDRLSQFYFLFCKGRLKRTNLREPQESRHSPQQSLLIRV